jgi:hypothetical protein
MAGLCVATLLGFELTLLAGVATREIRDAEHHTKNHENDIYRHDFLLIRAASREPARTLLLLLRL